MSAQVTTVSIPFPLRCPIHGSSLPSRQAFDIGEVEGDVRLQIAANRQVRYVTRVIVSTMVMAVPFFEIAT